jgi:hypothetical protein
LIASVSWNHAVEPSALVRVTAGRNWFTSVSARRIASFDPDARRT